MSEKTIAVDLDGVVFQYDEWKGIDHFGEPVFGVRQALRFLKNSLDYRIEIYTTRMNKETNKGYTTAQLRKKVADALLEHRIPFDDIVLAKPLADFYIDDRAIRFKDWISTVNFIRENPREGK